MHNLVHCIDRLKSESDAIADSGSHSQADEFRLNRQFTVAAVDQDGKTDRGRPAQVANRVDRRSNCPASKQDVVDENDFCTVNIERNLGASQHWPAIHAFQIVAIQCDINRANRDLFDAAYFFKRPCQPESQGHAASPDSDQVEGHVPASRVSDLPRDGPDQTLHFRLVAQPALGLMTHFVQLLAHGR
jgi:hypothetical protein